jgi:spoIIIJ-associated protein
MTDVQDQTIDDAPEASGELEETAEAVIDADEATVPTKGRPKRESLLEREGDVAADYLEGLLDIADLDGDIDIDVEGNRAMVSVLEVSPGDLGHLVGDGGRVLDALQELTRLAATRETGERSRLMLDVAGFRAARRAEIVAIAEAAVAEAKRTEAPVRLDPMTPFERKVVHDVVADAGLKSESDGDEPARRVVIRTA